MAMIHVNRNRETLGKFTDQEVADGLKSGRFFSTDLAWQEPMPAWQPLATFTDLPEPSLDEGKSVEIEIPAESAVEPLWEGLKGFSIVAAARTTKQIFEKPGAIFSNLPSAGGIGRSLVFFLVLSWFCGTVATAYECLAIWINPGSLLETFSQFPEPVKNEVQSWLDTNGYKKAVLFAFAFSVVFQPFVLLVRIFVFSLLAHGFLALVGGRSRNFAVTFRALAYSSGAASALQLFPLIGGLLGVVGSFVLGFIALKNAHGASSWRVALAVFFVLMAVGGLVLFLSIAFFAGVMALSPKS